MDDNQNQDRPEAEETKTPGAEPKDSDGTGRSAAFLSFLLGGAARPGIHEMGVHGSVIEQTVGLVEKYMTPGVVQIEEPGTGIKVLVAVGKDGVTPIGQDVFDAARGAPRFRRGTATLLDLDSFIAHVQRFADPDTVIFADNDRTKPTLTAVLDYNLAGSTAAPRFGKHRSAFAFPLSDEWKAWNAQNAEPMKMTDFARFLEDRIIDVMPTTLISLNDEQKLFVETLGGTNKIADPAKLMQLATELQIFENSVVREATKIASGETVLEFSSEHVDQAGQKISIPSTFVLGIPVFKGGAVYQVLARLRYRKAGSQIVFWFELWRTDRVFDHAFDEAVDRVEEETSQPVFLGKPEA